MTFNLCCVGACKEGGALYSAPNLQEGGVRDSAASVQFTMREFLVFTWKVESPFSSFSVETLMFSSLLLGHVYNVNSNVVGI